VLEQVSEELKNRPADGAALWFGEPQLPALRFCSSTEAGIGPRLTERNVQRVVAELAAAGYLTPTRNGRRNRYTIHRRRPLREPLLPGGTLGAIIDLAKGKAR